MTFFSFMKIKNIIPLFQYFGLYQCIDLTVEFNGNIKLATGPRLPNTLNIETG